MINDFIQWIDWPALALATGLAAGLFVAARIFADANDRYLMREFRQDHPDTKADTDSDTEANS